jgi:hypothetical protein
MYKKDKMDTSLICCSILTRNEVVKDKSQIVIEEKNKIISEASSIIKGLTRFLILKAVLIYILIYIYRLKPLLI